MIPGIVFDVRSVLLSISGLFLEFIPTLIAILATSIYRISLGGNGMWMGLAVIISSGTIGLLWNTFRPKWRSKNTMIELLAMGFVVHIGMLGCTIFLPYEVVITTLKTILLPILTIYPLVTMLLGLLMINWANSWQNRNRLKVSEEKYRILLDESTDPIFSFAPDGTYTYANKAFAEGVEKRIDQIIDKKIWDVFPKEEAEKRFTAVKQVFSSGEEKIIEVKVSRNNNDRYYLTTVTPIKDETGKVISVICSSKNITERKLAEEKINKLNEELETKVIDRTIELEIRTAELAKNESALLNLVEDLNIKSEKLKQSGVDLQRANKELEAFAYSVSHDLRAPLRAIDGFTRILMENSFEQLDDEGKRVCTIISENTHRMGQLIDDLLSFSRLVQSDLNCVPLDMGKLINNTYQEITTPAIRERTTFKTQPLPVVFADSSMMKQVWINLISNAMKFSNKTDHSEIEVKCNESNDNITFSISDNGVGFDMKYASKLFRVFQRLHSLKEFEGSGVGLALAQRIIQRHKGKLWAEAEIDKGATFYFTLPKRERV